VILDLRRWIRHTLYALRGGFLVRPLVIAFVLGAIGATLPRFEASFGVFAAVLGPIARGLTADSATAQGILGAVISAVMTVVSIVLSVLLVALTLASMQFSPRILTGFVEDRASQRTIGIFLGTFLYCLAAYPVCSVGARGSVCAVAVLGATVLAMTCVVALVQFIHHIALSINVNFITERIALETERVIDDVMPEPRAARPRLEEQPLPDFGTGAVLVAPKSGYVRFVDASALRRLARRHGVVTRVERRVGQFVPAGVPLLRLTRKKELNVEAFLEAIDIGPVRTMEQDIEFGLLQLVDIALKAISPAVNDPSTAINCIDQLSRLLARVVEREPMVPVFYEPPGVVRVVLAPITFEHLLEVSFSQIIHYGKADFAVSLRILRALGDIAAVTDDPRGLAALDALANGVATQCLDNLPRAPHEAVRERLRSVLERAMATSSSARSSPITRLAP